jgi:hypothetical protein
MSLRQYLAKSENVQHPGARGGTYHLVNGHVVYDGKRVTRQHIHELVTAKAHISKKYYLTDEERDELDRLNGILEHVDFGNLSGYPDE